MKTSLKRIQTTIGLATGVAALLLTAGCSSTGYDKGNKTAQDIQTVANRVAGLPTQIDKTVAALDDLVSKPQTDLRPQFKQFTANLSDVESTAKEIASARVSMGAKSKEFFDAWDAQLATINNEDIKARSQARRADVMQKLSEIKKSYTEAAADFHPFLSELQDVRKYLSVDLTPGGLAAIKTTVSKIDTDAAKLNGSAMQLADKFRALGLAMSSVTPAAK